jgi:phage shock protein PspC (stress-responsive transcriptional regulator)
MTDQEPTEITPPPPEAEPAPTTEPEPEPTVAEGPPPDARPRRLERSRDDRVIAGVCGGLGEYLGVDAVLIRIAALVLVFAGGAGLLLYGIGWIAMPETEESEEGADASTGAAPAAVAIGGTSGATLLGLVFVVLGVFFLVDEIWSDFLAWKYVSPIALIAVGAAVLVRARQ